MPIIVPSSQMTDRLMEGMWPVPEVRRPLPELSAFFPPLLSLGCFFPSSDLPALLRGICWPLHTCHLWLGCGTSFWGSKPPFGLEMTSESKPRFESYGCHLLTVWPRTERFTPLCLGFLSDEVKTLPSLGLWFGLNEIILTKCLLPTNHSV